MLSRELGTCEAPGMSYTIPRVSSQSNTTELSVDLLTEQVFNSHLFKKMKHHSTSIPPLFPPPTHTPVNTTKQIVPRFPQSPLQAQEARGLIAVLKVGVQV